MESDEEHESASEAEEDMEMEQEEEDDEDDALEEDTRGSHHDYKVYMPGQPLEDDQELVHDKSAYDMYYAAQTGAPCLSFDVLRDSLGENRVDYTMTGYLVSGTQAEVGKQNFIMLLKMSDLNSTRKENDDESDEEDEELDDEEPQLDMIRIQHSTPINRIRVAPLSNVTLVATWAESGKVHLWDVTKHVVMLDSPTVGVGVGGASAVSLKGHKETPIQTFSGHKSEGFAVDWSPTVPGRLATGDCKGAIHLWNTHEKNSWTVEPRPFTGHTDSVEDIQWSPNEETVFASCSVDRTIRVWDVRAKPNKACMITTEAHEADVNVIHWNRNEPFIVSGGDDGVVKVWDLRQIKSGVSVGLFKHHSKPVTSVEWHPSDSSVFASAGADNQIAQWDLAVEKDDEAPSASCTQDDGTAANLDSIPPQLLFIHQGQDEIKEIHWHPQLPGVLISTALSGLNIFKSISV